MSPKTYSLFVYIRSLLLLVLILSVRVIFAQSAKQDSITHRYDSLAKEKLNTLDSSKQRVNQKIDSVQMKVNGVLNPELSLNTLTRKIKLKRKPQDSIKAVHEFDSSRQQLSHHIDSLKQLNLPTEKFTHKLDSLNQLGSSKYITKAEAKVNNLQHKINQPVDKVEGAINEKLSLLNKEGGAGANLPGNVNLPNTSMPNTQLPNASLPNTSIPNSQFPNTQLPNANLPNASMPNANLGEVKSIPQEQIGKVKSIDEVKNVQEKAGAANQLTDKAQAYGDDVKNIAKGDLNEVKELPKAAEQQAMKLDEVQGIQKEAGQFDQYKQMADKAKNPEAMKEQVIQQASTMAVNHFAGKEQVLKEAMDKMSKLKSKYSELNSLKDIPKRKPNAMRGKPFIERLVPGITLQIQKSKDVIVDYNPNIGYRFYGKFTAGAGWNERFSVGKHFKFHLKDRIYGPRVFADFKIGKGFSVRTDIEKMNTYVPALTSNGYSTTEGYRAWVWSAFVGLKKEYTFMKGVKGNAQFLYNLYDDHDNSPYAERLAVRMGFEFSLKKKVRKE